MCLLFFDAIVFWVKMSEWMKLNEADKEFSLAIWWTTISVVDVYQDDNRAYFSG